MVDPVPKANVLAVDDFEPWRSKIREILQARPEWTIVSEARATSPADGKAQKARWAKWRKAHRAD